MSLIKKLLPDVQDEPVEELPPEYQAELDRVSVLDQAFNKIFGKREDAQPPF